MSPEETLTAALERLRPGLDLSDVEIVYSESDSGLLARSRLRPDHASVARLYLDKSTGSVYVVPSSVGNVATMDRAVADPEWRSRLTVI